MNPVETPVRFTVMQKVFRYFMKELISLLKFSIKGTFHPNKPQITQNKFSVRRFMTTNQTTSDPETKTDTEIIKDIK